MLAVGATVCSGWGRGGEREGRGGSLACSYCSGAHFVLAVLKAVTEEGGEVGLGHGAGDLLQEELHLLLVRSHRRAAVGGKLHHGKKCAEQVALCVVVIAFHQLVAGSERGGRERRVLRARVGAVRPPHFAR